MVAFYEADRPTVCADFKVHFGAVFKAPYLPGVQCVALRG